MRTAGPAARPALAFFELRTHPLDMLSSGFGLFYRNGPADPFITRERRDVFPCAERSLVRCKGFTQIRRDFVHDAARDCFFGHMFCLPHSSDIVVGDRVWEKSEIRGGYRKAEPKDIIFTKVYARVYKYHNPEFQLNGWGFRLGSPWEGSGKLKNIQTAV
jgi:hypothetical protein